MRRYGIARWMTDEQRERAARAVYERVEIPNLCRRGCCEAETYMAVRSVDPLPRLVCPLGVALDMRISPDAWEADSALSSGVSTRTNDRRLKAIQRFIHDVDSGKIGPDQVAEALGVEIQP